jgi:hypothetical protein
MRNAHNNDFQIILATELYAYMKSYSEFQYSQEWSCPCSSQELRGLATHPLTFLLTGQSALPEKSQLGEIVACHVTRRTACDNLFMLNSTRGLEDNHHCRGAETEA